jgi:hypothetical protein
MSEATTEPHVNGTAPTPAAGQPCEDCATSGEKILAVLAALLGAFVIAMAIDMFTGGRLSGMVKDARQ